MFGLTDSEQAEADKSNTRHQLNMVPANVHVSTGETGASPGSQVSEGGECVASFGPVRFQRVCSGSPSPCLGALRSPDLSLCSAVRFTLLIQLSGRTFSQTLLQSAASVHMTPFRHRPLRPSKTVSSYPDVGETGEFQNKMKRRWRKSET